MYKRQALADSILDEFLGLPAAATEPPSVEPDRGRWQRYELSLIHISEPTRPY